MKLGSARVRLSPAGMFYLIGFRSDTREHPATGIHDDIFGNALLMQWGSGEELFIFSADVIEFEEEMAEEVKSRLASEFGICRDLVLLCATHDHSSLMSYHRGWYTGIFDEGYYQFLIEAIIESFRECRLNARCASAWFGSRVITGYYGNRNHPGELADNEVGVLSFRDDAGEEFAGIVSWAVHSTVIGPQNTELSGDLAGAVCRELEKRWGFYPAFIVGAAADCSNRNERKGNDFTELKRVGRALAGEIAEIERSRRVHLAAPLCQTFFHTVHHDMSAVHRNARASIKRNNERLSGELSQVDREFLTKQNEELAAELKIERFHLDIKASVIDMGELQLMTFPGELASSFGVEIKNNSSKVVLFAGYTNGNYGYFLPADEYGKTFETIGSRIPSGTAEAVTEKFIQASRLTGAVVCMEA